MVEAAQSMLAATSTLAAGAGVVVGAAACVPLSIMGARLLNLPAKISALAHHGWTSLARPMAMVALALAACIMLGVVSMGVGVIMPVFAVVSLLSGLLLMAIAPVGPVRRQEQAIVVKPTRPAVDAKASPKPAKPEPRKAA